VRNGETLSLKERFVSLKESGEKSVAPLFAFFHVVVS